VLQTNNRNKNRKKGKNPMVTAFKMGESSFKDGRCNHPYKKDTILAKEWQRGWDRAYFSQQKNPVFEHSEEEEWDKKTEEWRRYFEDKNEN
jgi:hypothetical protein